MRIQMFALVLVAMAAANGEKADSQDKAAPPTEKLPATVRITREAALGTLVPSDRQFSVECRIVSPKLSFSLPEITVRDGEKTTLADTSTSTEVVAYKVEHGRKFPISREIAEGTTAEITVVGVSDKQVVVDCTLTLQGACAGMKEEHRGKRFSGSSGQIVDCIELGEKASCPLAMGSFEVIVKESPVPQRAE